MPTSTYDLIASNVLGSSAASVTFSSIPATYRDLILVVNALGSGGSNFPGIRYNSDSGGNYSWVHANGDGSLATSSSQTGQTYAIITNDGYPTTTTRAVMITSIMDYSATDKHKSALSRGNNASNGTSMVATRWANTAAITSIEVLAISNNFASGSSFYLYGIVS